MHSFCFKALMILLVSDMKNKATVYMQDLLRGILDFFPTSCPAFHLLQ